LKERKRYAIAIHGGAGTVSKIQMTEWKEKAFQQALMVAITIGEGVLKKGGKALDAVTEAVVSMEDCTLFNAGKGSVFTHTGNHEMDASIMDGKNLKAGAVSSVSGVKNPILFARLIMEKSKHVMMAGEEALNYARTQNVQFEDNAYFYDEFRYKQWLKVRKKDEVSLDHDEGKAEKYGTVGAVALDRRGNLAAATSTGGMVNKRNGRVGDSPIIGAGTYADNRCGAISCTGHGEYFIRLVAAHEVLCHVKYNNVSLSDAAHEFIHQTLKNAGGRGGLIAVDTDGRIAMPFNTKGMYRASKQEGEEPFVGIYHI
jgi:beta-aspartyl-peptidase (threonine type)